MSYQIIKNLRTEDGKIKCEMCSSNVSPKTYYGWEREDTDETRDMVRGFLRNREWQPQRANSFIRSLNVESMASPEMVALYGFSYGERCPRWATNFRDEREAAEWLRRAANGTGALEPSAVDILKAAPDCLIWYSRRDDSYNCDYISDNEGRPIHGTIEDYRALLLYYRKCHILEHIANDIRKAVEMGCTFVVSTADHRARVEVKRDDENGIYIASWYVGDERDSTRAHLHAIEAAEMVHTFREGYACDLDDIVTEAEGIKVGDKVRHNKHEDVATVTAIREAFVNCCDGYRYLYTLDFGQSVKGPFDVELNGGEFLREALIISTAKGILS